MLKNSVFGALKGSDAKAASSPGPFGRFYLQEMINTGGMADIWLATDSNGKAVRPAPDARPAAI